MIEERPHKLIAEGLHRAFISGISQSVTRGPKHKFFRIELQVNLYETVNYFTVTGRSWTHFCKVMNHPVERSRTEDIMYLMGEYVNVEVRHFVVGGIIRAIANVLPYEPKDNQ